MTLQIIRELWIAGNAGLLASLVLPHPAGIIVMGVADAVLAVAWVWAIGRAFVTEQATWACLIAVMPVVMWGYIFALADEPLPVPQSEPVTPIPAPPALSWRDVACPPESLAVRQARKTIAEAERRYPDW